MPLGTPIIEAAWASVPQVLVQYADDYKRVALKVMPDLEFSDGKLRGFLLREGVMFCIALSDFPL